MLLHLIVMLEDPKNGLRYVVHDHIQVNLIWFVTLSIERMLKCDNIWVIKLFHDLQFSILVPLVLIHFFDGYLLAILIDSCLEDNPK